MEIDKCFARGQEDAAAIMFNRDLPATGWSGCDQTIWLQGVRDRIRTGPWPQNTSRESRVEFARCREIGSRRAALLEKGKSSKPGFACNPVLGAYFEGVYNTLIPPPHVADREWYDF